MKKTTGAQSPQAAPGRLRSWMIYGAAAALFVAGQLAISTNMTRGIILIGASLLLAAAQYVLPSLPWAAWKQAWREMRQARPAAPAGPAPKGARAAKASAPAPLAPRVPLKQALHAALDGLALRLFPEDSFEASRYWLLVLASLLLLLSLLGLNKGSVPQAVGFFVGAGMFGAIYLQNALAAIRVEHMRQNLSALAHLALALPFQVFGTYLLHARFESRAAVWTAFILCALASAWMIRSLKRHPLDLTVAGDREATLEWAPSAAFFGIGRLAVVSTLLAAALVSAYLAEVVLPAEHAGWSVGFGFLAIALLIGSFPWIPRGLAWSAKLLAPLRGFAALGAVLLAVFIGNIGQDAIERGAVNNGLWYFLVGGVLLILGLSRFEGFAHDPSQQTALGAEKRKPVVEVAAVLLLMAVGFSFRIWKIGVFPYGVEGDEGGGGLWAMDVLMGRVEHPLIHQNYPLAFFSVTALFFKVAGVTLSTLRWHSVLFGTISIASTYFFMRLLMGRWTAFLATLLMSFSYWHLHYSRFGHYNIEQVAMQMTAFYFVFKAMRDGKLWQWVCGGVAFGLAMFPHMAGRLLPFEGIALVLYFLVGRRDLLRRYAPGFLAFVLASWAIAAPAVVYWNRARSISLGRIQSVSIFDKNNTNAPVDTLAGFVNNCKVSMLMFNYLGDTRQRDNPLAPEKILEHWTAVLFALAFVFALYHWRDPVAFFLLAVFFANLAASVFSVEAPQTLRTAGNIPIIFALIALPLARLRLSMLGLGRARGTLIFALLLLPAFGYFSYRSARKYYVDARRMQFDITATYVAQKAGQAGGPNTQAAFWGTGFASSHPPMILLTQDTPLRNFYAIFEYLPVNKLVDRDHLLFLVDDYQGALPYMKWLYPKAPVEPLADEVNGGAMAQYIRVNKDVIRGTLGMDGQAMVAGKAVPLQGVEPKFPGKGYEDARKVSLKSSLKVDTFGRYTFEVSGQGPARVVVDGHSAFTRGGRPTELLLARGQHSLELVFEPRSPADAMAVKMTVVPPHGQPAAWVQRGRSETVLGLADTLRVPVTGFYGEYYAARMPEGPPLVEVIEPVVVNNWLDAPIVGNWTARWSTRFKVDQAGVYRFSQRGGAMFASVKVDGKLVWRQGSDPKGEMHPPAVQPAIALKPGWHDYVAVFTTSGAPSDQLRWSPPGGGDELFWVPEMKPLNNRMPR